MMLEGISTTFDKSSYDGVREDFEMYSTLVKNNGIIAFHDISTPSTVGFGVARYWNEIKSRCEYTEIVDDQNQSTVGIGLIKND